jgi:type V secretory pathway adhesin AidA
VSDGTVSFDGAEVVAADIIASNGVVHVINQVIVPESCVSAPVDAPATTTAAPTNKPTNEPTSSGTIAAATAAVISAGVAMMFI